MGYASGHEETCWFFKNLWKGATDHKGEKERAEELNFIRTSCHIIVSDLLI